MYLRRHTNNQIIFAFIILVRIHRCKYNFKIRFSLAVCFKQHNILELIQDETVNNIRRDPYGVRCNIECGKLQVITIFIEHRYRSIANVKNYDKIYDIFVPQLLQETGDDIAAVCASDIVPVATVLVSLSPDVHEVDHVFSCVDG